MKAKIVQIGNSKGVRLPKAMLDACNFHGEISVTLEKKRIILSAAKKQARQGWRESFLDEKSAKKKEKFSYIPSKFDSSEWEW